MAAKCDSQDLIARSSLTVQLIIMQIILLPIERQRYVVGRADMIDCALAIFVFNLPAFISFSWTRDDETASERARIKIYPSNCSSFYISIMLDLDVYFWFLPYVEAYILLIGVVFIFFLVCKMLTIFTPFLIFSFRRLQLGLQQLFSSNWN